MQEGKSYIGETTPSKARSNVDLLEQMIIRATYIYAINNKISVQDSFLRLISAIEKSRDDAG